MSDIINIEYRKHPAFVALAPTYTYDDIEIDNFIQQIDNALTKTYACTNENELRKEFSEEVSSTIDELKAYVKQNCSSIIAFEFFCAALEYTKNELLHESFRILFRKNYKSVSSHKKFDDDLEKDGMHIVSFSKKTMEEMKLASKPYYERLKQKALCHPEQRSYDSVNMKDPLGIAIYKMIDEANILPSLSNYMKTELTVMGVGIEYSHEGQSWSKGCYNDVGLKETQLAYMHFDEAAYAPKTLCYITPVKEADNGATKYIKGSHKWVRSEFVFLFHKGLDRISSDRYYNIFDGYYRPLYKHEELRKLLLHLPQKLMGTSHVGDDILDGTDLSKKLLNEETTFLSDGCEAIVFDGGRGYHKGAIVTKGERLSLQIVYIGKNESKIDILSKNETPMNRIKKIYHILKQGL